MRDLQLFAVSVVQGDVRGVLPLLLKGHPHYRVKACVPRIYWPLNSPPTLRPYVPFSFHLQYIASIYTLAYLRAADYNSRSITSAWPLTELIPPGPPARPLLVSTPHHTLVQHILVYNSWSPSNCLFRARSCLIKTGSSVTMSNILACISSMTYLHTAAYNCCGNKIVG